MRFFLIVFLIVLLSSLNVSRANDNILDIQEVTTQSGIKAWLVEDDSVPVISLSFSFLGAGSAQDSAKKQGLTRLASNTMDEGAGDLSAQQFQKRLKNLSTTLYFQSSRDHFSGELKTLTKNQDEAFNLLRMAILQPRFDQEAIDRMRQANQSRVRSSLSDPKWIAARIMNDRLYESHTYALNSGGSISSLENITKDDLKTFSKTRLGKNNLRIAVAGDINAAELAARLELIFSDLQQTVTLQSIDHIGLQNSGNIYVHEKDVPQTIVELSYPGLARENPDYIGLQVLNYILGSSGFGSRLMDDIREKRGLTYSIYSSLLTLDKAQNLTISSSTKNDSAQEMLFLIKNIVQDLKTNGATQEELDNARSYLIGSLPLSLTSTDKITRVLISLMQHNLPVDYLQNRNDTIEALTLSDIKRIAQNYLDPEQFVAVLVGSPSIDKTDDTIEIQIVDSIPNAE